MKIYKILVLVIALASVWACTKDDPVPTYPVDITLTSTQSDISLDGLTVKFTSQTGREYTAISVTTIIPEDADSTITAVATATIKVEQGVYELLISEVKEELRFVAGLSGISVTENGETVTIEVEAAYGGASSGLVIEEIFYTYMPYIVDGEEKKYGNAAFLEIYNNSDKVIYLDKLCIANAAPWNANTRYYWNDENGNPTDPFVPVESNHILSIPGNGTDTPLEPGKSIVIANNGMDHSSATISGDAQAPNLSTVKGDAQYLWEFYNNQSTSSRSIDNPGTPNIDIVRYSRSYAWTLSSRSPAMMIFRFPNNDTSYISNPDNLKFETGSEGFNREYLTIDKSFIIDAVEITHDLETQKRFPLSVDAEEFDGTAVVNTGKSVRRKVVAIKDGRAILQDNNNSAQDLIVQDVPAPFVVPKKVD